MSRGLGVVAVGASRAAAREVAATTPPPPTDRGVENTSCHGVHSQTVTIWAHREYVLYALDRLLGAGEWVTLGKGGRAFKSLESGPLGVKLYSAADLPYCSVEIPGSAAESLDFERLRCWYVWLRDVEGVRLRFSRVDLFFDGCPFTPAMAYEAFKSGDIRTRARRDSYRWQESAEGNTFYLGKRDSERFLRVYDKRGFTRLELELSGERADLVMWEVIGAADVAETMLGHVRAYVDFVESASDSNLSRAVSLSWWAEFIGAALKSSLVVPVAQRTLQQVRQYIANTWGAMFATLNDWKPEEMYSWFGELLLDGRKKQTSRHRRLLALS